MSEISSPRPLPSSPPVIRSTVTAADLAVRLLQPLEEHQTPQLRLLLRRSLRKKTVDSKVSALCSDRH